METPRCAYCFNAECAGECMDTFENASPRVRVSLPPSAYLVYPESAAMPPYYEPDAYEPF